jgi:hypothetical protein
MGDTTLRILTHSITTLSVYTFSITTLSIKGLFVTFRINDIHHTNTIIVLSVVRFSVIKPNVIMLSVIRLVSLAGVILC